MSRIVKPGELESIIQSSGSKLVAIDFSNEWCGPCKMIHPFWESLVPKYPNVVFCTVNCDSCPSETMKFAVMATPTFVFYQNGKEVRRFSGANVQKITETINELNVLNLEPPQELLNDLLDMGFQLDDIKTAYRETNGGEIDQIISYFEDKQKSESNVQQTNQSQNNNEEQNKTNNEEVNQDPAPKQSEKQEKIANDLTRELSEEGEKAKQQLVEMGFDGELAQIAINVAGHQDIQACIDIIHKIERGEPIPQPKRPNRSQEEIDATIAHYRELLAKKNEQKNNPKLNAQSELERRKQVLADLDFRKSIEEKKRLQAIEDARKEKIREKMERDKVKQKIAAQREAQKKAQQSQHNQQTSAQHPQPTPHTAQPAQPKKAPTECTLRLQMENGTAHVAKFQPTDTLSQVEKWIKSNVSEAAGKTITFEIAFPRKVLTRADFAKTLLDLGLCPRSQLMVKY